MFAPLGYAIGPAKIDFPVDARNRSYCKNKKKHGSWVDPKVYVLDHIPYKKKITLKCINLELISSFYMELYFYGANFITLWGKH